MESHSLFDDVEKNRINLVDKKKILRESEGKSFSFINLFLFLFTLSIASFALISNLNKVNPSSSSLVSPSSPSNGNGGLSSSDSGSLDGLGRYLLNDYDQSKPFSSFLPALAGRYGIPLWAFYVNRGQAISSFGVRNKDGSIMEFLTANKAYSETPRRGFRSVIKGKKINRNGSFQNFIHEPFFTQNNFYDLQTQNNNNLEEAVPLVETSRVMKTGLNEVELEELCPTHSIKSNVLYFTLTNQDFPALMRQATFKNIDPEATLEISLVDGLASIVPAGVSDLSLKTMGRTMEAFMDVFNIDENDSTLPFYQLRAGSGDNEEVFYPSDGNFAAAWIDNDSQTDINTVGQAIKRLPIIADPAIVFGLDTTLTLPSTKFAASTYEELLNTVDTQSTASRTASAFSLSTFKLTPGQSITINSIYGHARNLQHLTDVIAPLISLKGFSARKLAEARTMVNQLTDPVQAKTALPVFDASLRQLYLDNGLRGGFGLILGSQHDGAGVDLLNDKSNNQVVGTTSNSAKVFYTYSRLHGDIERDYNAFVIEPQYYSQGPGNYRDVNQNRRSDVIFNPRLGSVNVRQFLSLIQADGYNPLTVLSSSFKLPVSSIYKVASAVTKDGPLRNKLCDILGQVQLTPGSLFSQMDQAQITPALTVSREDFLSMVARESDQNVEASYGTGYWTDHWTYNLDHVKSYLTVYPDKEAQLLYDEWIPFFYSPATIQPRDRKYVISGPSQTPHQLNAVYWDGEKQAKTDAHAAKDPVSRNWQHVRSGEQGVFAVPIVGKLVVLAVVKLAGLDPQSMGLEMEGGKPGWLDALNGLPALFGSSMAETYELLRLHRYLRDALQNYPDRIVYFPIEAEILMKNILAALDHHGEGGIDASDSELYGYWNEVYNAKELYRSSIRLTFDGAQAQWKSSDLALIFSKFIRKLESGIARARTFHVSNAEGAAVPPTYFRWTATQWENLVGQKDWQGRQFVRVTGFAPTPLALFLEGPVRQFKIETDFNNRKALYQNVKQSPLYDRKLSMYKICDSVADDPVEIGRIKAFTPGWLENESVWTHMSYKYYLELIRGGLYSEFYTEASTGLIAFMNSKQYGRSVLEVSSFIASSAYSDSLLWGTGFVSRLSGATAEMMSIWLIMAFGPEPFSLDPVTRQLRLSFAPILSKDFFPRDIPQVQLTFLSSVQVTYYHPARVDTWESGVHVASLSIVTLTGQSHTFQNFIPSPYAEMVRSSQVKTIHVTLAKS